MRTADQQLTSAPTLAATGPGTTLWARVSSFLSPTVAGNPPWYAQYLEQGLCRLKWLSAVGLPLWILQAMALNAFASGEYRDAASYLGTSTRALINGAVAVGLFAALVTLLVGRERISIRYARSVIMFGVPATIGSEALLVGFAHLNFERVASLDLTVLLVLACAPMTLSALSGIALGVLGITFFSAWMSGLSPNSSNIVFLVHPLSFSVLGIVVNRWYFGLFKATRIAELRLKRHAQSLERQAQLIERQRNEAESQRARIAAQQLALQHVLASALTTPVAEAYEREGHFATEFKTVCVIACDAVGFSDTCRKMQPERVVAELENFFRKFDAACFKFRVEPLRAQGDSRIALAGLWPDVDHGFHHKTISAVLAMLYFKRALPPLDGRPIGADADYVLWPARIGICLGPASCGVIDTGGGQGESAISGRLWFDAWGDTVNLAARLEQAAQPNQILVREGVLWETCGLFDYGPIRKLQVKTTVIVDATEILGIRKVYQDENGLPNSAFWEVYNSPVGRPHRPNPAGSLASDVDANPGEGADG